MSSPPPTDAAPPSEARLRAEARKAKIQARGADRLAKLANTARGEEGAKLYEDAKPLAPRPTASTNDSSSSLATVGASAAQQQQPSSQGNPFAGMEQMFPGFPPASAGGPAGDDPFAAMLQAMQAGGGPGAGFPGAAGGDGQDPFADPFAAMLSSMGGMGSSGEGFPAGFGQQQLEQPYSGAKTRMDRLFDLAHGLGVVGLVLFVLRWWEPAVWARRGGDNFVDLGGYVRPAPMAGVELPVFWAFVTISLILQTSRALLFQSRPPPSKLLSLASPFLPLLPPRLKTCLFTASRYLSVGTQFVQDLSLLVFLLGVARWLGGPERIGNIVS